MINHDDNANNDELSDWLELRCSTCNYSLRGLVGDPIRCPECGELNGRGAATAQALDARARRLDTLRTRLDVGPSLCAIAVGTAVFMSCCFLVFRTFFETIRGPVMVTCAFVWALGFLLFFARSFRLRGWLVAFVNHQVFGVLAALGNVAVVFAALVLGAATLGVLDASPGLVIFVPFAAVIGVWKGRPMRWFSRKATAALEPLVAQLYPDDKLDDVDDSDGGI